MGHNPSRKSSEQTPAGEAQHQRKDPYRWHALVVVLIMCVTGPSLLAAVAYAVPAQPEHPLAAAAAELGVTPLSLQVGKVKYAASCSLCHGSDGTGVPRLGKPLRDSAYVRNRSDSELFSIIAYGRLTDDPENTTGTLMPARGGQGLSDQSVVSVVAYLRSMQDFSNPTVSVEDWVVDLASQGGTDLASDLVGSIGHELFVASCSACHGSAGEGVEGLGLALDVSIFTESLSDEDLIKFIKSGRPTWDSENITGA